MTRLDCDILFGIGADGRAHLILVMPDDATATVTQRLGGDVGLNELLESKADISDTEAGVYEASITASDEAGDVCIEFIARMSVFRPGEVENLIEKLRLLAKLHEPKYEHHCLEWDQLTISEFDPEFDACLCYPKVNELRRIIALEELAPRS